MLLELWYMKSSTKSIILFEDDFHAKSRRFTYMLYLIYWGLYDIMNIKFYFIVLLGRETALE